MSKDFNILHLFDGMFNFVEDLRKVIRHNMNKNTRKCSRVKIRSKRK